MEGQEVFCTRCAKKFALTSAFPKRTFLGFLKLICPNCKKKFSYPLTDSYRSIYQLIIIMSIVGILYAFFYLKEIPLLSPIGLLAIIALWRDRGLKKVISAQHYQTNNKRTT